MSSALNVHSGGRPDRNSCGPGDVKGYTSAFQSDRHSLSAFSLGVCLCEIPFHLLSALMPLVMFCFFLQLS